ncbi:MAG: hypothetical protein PHT79_07240 [Syntrophomonadaceae bacterium]|nr:hypothetical protein [Syntrophomonadaceae bacterium]MDD4549535.1 hypothetical protein [Syntrophomonadaceae bacterium]
MKIGDRVIISEPRHPLFQYKGMLVGFRGEGKPGDIWLLILVDLYNRSYLVPQSMVELIPEENDTNNNEEL